MQAGRLSEKARQSKGGSSVQAQGEELESHEALKGSSRVPGEVVRVFRRNTHCV